MDLALQGLWAETRTLDLALFQREGSIRSASPKETFVEKVTTAARVVNRLVKGSALKKVPDHFSFVCSKAKFIQPCFYAEPGP